MMSKTKNGMRIITIFAVLMMLISVMPISAMAVSDNAASDNANGQSNKMYSANGASAKATDDDSSDDSGDTSKLYDRERIRDQEMINATENATRTRAEIAKMNSGNAAGNYQAAKSNFANIKSQNPNLNTEEAINATKEYLISSIDYMLTFLDEEEDGDYIAKLEEERQKVEDANTRQELADSAKNIRTIWNDVRKDRVVSNGKVIDNKVGAVIQTSKNMANRLENEIVRMEQNGQDVTGLQNMLGEYNQLIASAEKNREHARNSYMYGEGTDAENIREANQYFTEAGKDITEANALLRNMFGVIKQQREGLITLSGTGNLTANGNGTVVLSGNITIDATAEDVNIIIKDLADDATINTDGATYNESNIDAGNSTDNNRAFVFIGLSGNVHIEGSRLTVMIKGTGINLEAEGTGSVVLAGEGTYIADGTNGQWANRISDDNDVEDNSENPDDNIEAETENGQEDGVNDSIADNEDSGNGVEGNDSAETEPADNEQGSENNSTDENGAEN
ncbi:MAG: hypothetical protein PWQ63_158 [Methanolobus sp.]|jgi:ligand-binding sensor protein|nr:hypothetical protein [Methanolobus sp.]MDK2946998.1 hypothetical protein [Methanolobus sp.]